MGQVEEVDIDPPTSGTLDPKFYPVEPVDLTSSDIFKMRKETSKMADFGKKMMHVQNPENNFPNEICVGKCSPKQDRGVLKGCYDASPS